MRRLRTRFGVGLLTSALAVPVAVAVPAGVAGAQPVIASAGAVAGRSTAVTLLTGDRILLLGDGSGGGGGVAVEPAPGRGHIDFTTRRVGDSLRVVPSDAMPLLAAGRLDPRLFDITTLIEAGYDDRRGDLPLIVTGDPGAATARVSALAGAQAGQPLPSIGGTAVRVAKDGGAFWAAVTAGGARTLAAGRTTIWLDGVRAPTLDVSVPQIGAPAAWQAGYTGDGVTVGVVDTGVDESHPDLAGQVVAARDFTGTGSDDTEGHGTHVASTIAGSGAASGGRYQGVAPGAGLLDAKVCVGRSCAESAIIAGMEWAAGQGARVVNMSLSGPDTAGLDPLEQAVENLTASHGTLFVTSAGNEGDEETVGSPASADSALAVGAVTKADELASFSSRGPRVGDGAIKPDVTAPGQEIVAARSSTSGIGDPASPYATLSGTSMASPHVAGAAAILAQRSPAATPAELKAVLMASARPHPDLGAFAQGAGRIDVAAAIGQLLTTSPPSLSFGQAAWPHDDDTPVTLTVRYRNAGDSPITVDLTVAARGEDGTPAPAGMFTTSVDTLTVPAGGEAEVTVTSDTRLDGPLGYVSGQLVATGGGVAATTPFAVDRQAQTHRLTAAAVDRDGNPASGYNAYLVSLDEQAEYDLDSADGSRSVRVPPGRYAVVAHIFTGSGEERSLTKLVQPLITVDGDVSVTLDARQGEPVSVSVPRPDASMILKEVSAILAAEWGDPTYGILSFSDTLMYTANVGPDEPVPGFTSYVNTEFVRRGPDGSMVDSPYYYHLAWHESGRMLDGLTRAVRDRDLARVRAEHAAQGDGSVMGAKSTTFLLPDGTSGVAVVAPFHLPFSRTEFYNTDGGVQWRDSFLQIGTGGGTDEITSTYAPPATYLAGRRYETVWNEAVFAPHLPAQLTPGSGVTRSGDTILVNVWLYGDQAGRQGFTTSATGRTALYHGGVLVGETDLAGQGQFAVSPDPADYRLEVTAALDPRLELSRTVSVAWTFPSEHVEGGGGKGDKDGAVPQRLSMVRFQPGVDAHNTLPAGRGYVIPVEVYGQGGATVDRPVALQVEASTDDGRTWRPVRTQLFRSGQGVVIMPPHGPGYVSLRAFARDARGGTVEVTIIRAYELAR